MTMSRRELFGWLRGPAPVAIDALGSIDAPVAAGEVDPVAPAIATAPPVTAFSLDAFYATRSVDREIPTFAIRATTATPTTRVGVGRTEAAAPSAERASELTAIAPELVPAVLPHRCLASSSFCSVCVERCPVEGAIVVALGRPSVDPTRCDGCGRCVAVCPAPVLAFALVPRLASAP